ncbi:hypothetical protein ACN47E_001994 [Coniothyrium glycines]
MDPFSITAGVVSTLAALGLLQQAKHKTAQKNRIGRDKPTFAGLDIVHKPDEADFDVCFVHGLTGDARSTWTKSNPENEESILWPRDLLARDFPRARILLYGYETRVNSVCWLLERTLYHHATHLLRDLENDRKRENCSNRPLLFIAHSLGGLLVKNALNFAKDDNPGSTPFHSIYMSTFGVVSFDSPHVFGGNASTDQSLENFVAEVCRLSENNSTTGRTLRFEDLHTKRWRKNIEILRTRLSRYKAIPDGMPELFCYGSDYRLISARKTIVPPETLVDMNHIYKRLSVEKDHVDICKFGSSNESAYQNLCLTIERFHRESTTVIMRRREANDEEGVSNTLSSDDMETFGFSISPQLQPRPYFVPRQTQFGEDYLEVVHRGLMVDRSAVIQGLAGKGKTTLALEYAHHWSPELRKSQGLFESIFWLHAASAETLKTAFAVIAEQLQESYHSKQTDTKHAVSQPEDMPSHEQEGVESAQKTTNLPEDKDTRREVLAWLSIPKNSRWLLIYDDVEDPDALYLQPYLPPAPSTTKRGYILMTQRVDVPELGISKLSPTCAPNQARHDHERRIDGLKSSTRVNMMGPDSDTASSSPTKTYFSAPIRVGSFNRNESLSVLGMHPDSETDAYATIAQTLDDDPQGLAQAGMFLDLEPSTQEVVDKYGRDESQFDDFSQDYMDWFDMCVMLGDEHIPVQLLSVRFNQNKEAVADGLKELQRELWLLIGKEDSQTFQLSKWHRRLRRQMLDEKRKRESAELACSGIVELLKSTSVSPSSKSTRSIEVLLLEHVNSCLENLKHFQRVIDCEWVILAQFCERHGLSSQAKVFYEADQSQPVANSNTESRSNKRRRKTPSKMTSSDVWHDARASDVDSEPDDTFYDVESLKSSYEHIPTLIVPSIDSIDERDTKTSRAMRSKLGEIRTKIRLGELNEADHMELTCREMLDKLQDRPGSRYADLRRQALEAMLHIKVAQENWAEAILYGYDLTDMLELTLGSFHNDTLSAVHEVATLHLKQGQYSRAQPLLEQVLMSYKQKWGNLDLRTIRVSKDLAAALKGQGDVERAKVLYSSISSRLRRKWGDEHILTAEAYEGLAIVHDMEQDFETADMFYGRALHSAEQLGIESREHREMCQRYDLLKKRRG